jgi:hypothetical protein
MTHRVHLSEFKIQIELHLKLDGTAVRGAEKSFSFSSGQP